MELVIIKTIQVLLENGDKDMASSGINFNGKVAVLNVNSMETYAGLFKIKMEIVLSINSIQILIRI